MNAEGVANLVRNLAPERLSERLVREFGLYDNTGLLLRPSEAEVSKVLVCLDADAEAAEEAAALGCQMIVSHHPVIYSPIQSVDVRGETRAVAELLRANLAVYSAHLSLDAAEEGINASFARALGLVNAEPLLALGDGAGLTFAGICETDFPTFAERVKAVTGGMLRVSENVKLAPGFRAAAANGGAADPETLALAKSAGCACLVSGDARHHAFVWAKNNGMNLIDAGHFETEHFYLKTLTDALNRTGAGVTFVLSGQTAPYHIL